MTFLVEKYRKHKKIKNIRNNAKICFWDVCCKFFWCFLRGPAYIYIHTCTYIYIYIYIYRAILWKNRVLYCSFFFFWGVLGGLGSSGRLVGTISTYPGTCKCPWSRVIAKNPPGGIFFFYRVWYVSCLTFRTESI